MNMFRHVLSRAVHNVIERFPDRIVEWLMACIILGFADSIRESPEILMRPGYAGFVGGAWVWGSITLCIAVLAIVALVINGSVARPTGIARAIALTLSMMFFGLLSYNFASAGLGSTAVRTYGILSVFSFLALVIVLARLMASGFIGPHRHHAATVGGTEPGKAS